MTRIVPASYLRQGLLANATTDFGLALFLCVLKSCRVLFFVFTLALFRPLELISHCVLHHRCALLDVVLRERRVGRFGNRTHCFDSFINRKNGWQRLIGHFDKSCCCLSLQRRLSIDHSDHLPCSISRASQR